MTAAKAMIPRKFLASLSIVGHVMISIINAVPLAGTDPSYMKEMEASMAAIVKKYVELEGSKLEMLTR